jgi:phage portal protein BeeE
MSAIDAQVIEQLKWAGENVCSAFGVPPFMVGMAAPPTYTNIEALTQQYWSQCLQSHIQDIECLLDEGMGLDDVNSDDEMGVKLDLNMLLRMDTATRYKTWKDGIAGGWLMPNEARKSENMTPVKGGDTPYMQVQNYSLEALSKRDDAAPAAPTGGGAMPGGQPALPAPKPEEEEPPPDKEFTELEIKEINDILRAA